MKVARSLFSFLLVALATFLSATGASAQQNTLLFVNVTNPAQVTITAAPGTALNSDAGKSFGAGVDLANFFRASASGSTLAVVGSTLTTFLNNTPTYDSAAADNLTSSIFVDLNLFRNNGFSSAQTFTSGQRAFNGTITLNLSGLGAALLPTVGTMGNIYSGNNFSGTTVGPAGTDVIVNQVVIGQFVVVPEAGPAVLLCVGSVLVVFGRQVRRRFAA